MKKLMIYMLCALYLLSGCSTTTKTDDSAQKYEDFQFLLNANENYQTNSNYFDITIDMSDLGNGEYRYYLFIDNPIVAMYDIEVIAIDIDQEDSTIMQPSIGIFESTVYNMIPFQYNLELGFSKGLMLSGTKTFTVDEDKLLTLNLLIQWYNEDRSSQTREYLSVSYRYVEEQVHDDVELQAQNEETDDSELADEE
ncbi:MAG: hypothetical protein R3Y57_07695 [Erysipelotrichaceae bacterium]